MSAIVIGLVIFTVLGILKNSPVVKTDPEVSYRTEFVSPEDNDYLN